MMGGRNFVQSLIFMLSGLLIWATHFLFIYVFAALACAKKFADAAVLGIGMVPLSIGVATVLAFSGAAAILWLSLKRLKRAQDRDQMSEFAYYIAAVVAGLALLAIIWNSLPVLVIPACA